MCLELFSWYCSRATQFISTVVLKSLMVMDGISSTCFRKLISRKLCFLGLEFDSRGPKAGCAVKESPEEEPLVLFELEQMVPAPVVRTNRYDFGLFGLRIDPAKSRGDPKDGAR
ncbi:hypothetical protein EUGRSUZ_J00473 [Eucalyptus grandis]|uniref:Uncharacterized protein n=2 Tax=Eucalyptus grandis TaxID=71139 RepID=A0ACC3J1U4_EUCGR|nr:hypothetical protein EUGRSUZ_J00473 [Eucalyptus grandis]